MQYGHEVAVQYRELLQLVMHILNKPTSEVSVYILYNILSTNQFASVGSAMFWLRYTKSTLNTENNSQLCNATTNQQLDFPQNICIGLSFD
jgi:hypothetical protein